MKRKMIPVILMLTAGAVTSIISYVRDYELTKMLWLLLATLIIFYILGLIVKKILDVFDEQIKRQEELEGAVIEKELAQEDEQTDEAAEETEQEKEA
jgi:hypothetical protein